MNGRTPGSPVRAAALVALILGLVAAAFWAGRVTLTPPLQAQQAPQEEVTITITEQQVGRVITLTTTVTRPTRPLATNQLAGTVTQVGEAGQVDNGDLLYAIEDTPVLLVEGDVPFWRQLEEGVEGDDVAQVQRMLRDAGMDLDPDGVWGRATTAALRQWQRDQGYRQTSGLAEGALVAAGSTPVSLTLDTEALWPGAVLSGGEALVSMAAGEPTFAMEVTPDQAALLPAGTGVSLQFEDISWDGVISGSTLTTEGLLDLAVTTPEGGVVCGDECDRLPATAESTLLTEAAVVPPETGPAVPVAALGTNPDGQTTLQLVDGDGVRAVPVTVRTIADGLAIVDGVEVGQQVRVFAASDTAVPAVPAPPAPSRPSDGTGATGDTDTSTSTP